MTEPDILAAKADLRRRALAAARAASADPDAATRLADNVIARIPLPHGSAVAAYAPLKSEIDPLPLLARLADAGFATALPVAEGDVLSFRRWTPGDTLIPGPFGTRHPPDSAQAIQPDILFVPLVAFDDDGYRLGRGGGWYDKTIAHLRRRHAVLIVGCAFAAQEIPHVPREPHDQRLDWIATEQGATPFGAAASP